MDDIVLHTDPTGAKTEALCDELFEIDGFVKYDSKIGSNNGFDGVYIKKNASGNVQEILINEAKQVSAVGNMRLSPANPNTGLKAQMSDAWIRDVIAQLKTNSSTSALGNTLETLFQNNRNLFTKTVTGVDRSSGEIIIIAKLEKY